MEQIRSTLAPASTRVTFTGIHKAILEANRAPPHAKKMVWQKVYQLSNQYIRQDEDTLQMSSEKVENLTTRP